MKGTRRLLPWLFLPALAAAWAFRHDALLSWVRRDHLVGIDVSHHQVDAFHGSVEQLRALGR